MLGTVAIANTNGRALVQNFGADRMASPSTPARTRSGVWHLPVKGWTEASRHARSATCSGFYGDASLRHALCTDIARDGMLGGFNFGLYRSPDRCAGRRFELQASGGVADLDELRACANSAGPVPCLGRALLEGASSLQDALAC